MPHITPPFSVIRDDQLRDIGNQLHDADVRPDSDYFVRASATASVAEGIYHDQVWIARQIFADTADIEYLELHCRTRDIYRKKATLATGPILLTGEPGAKAAAGLTMTRDNVSWITTTDTVIDATGHATASGSATITGSAGNTNAEQTGMLSATPDGFDSAVTVGVMRGGTEIESPESLLERYLDLLRRPPAGGNKYDYKRWALDVPGVTAAYVYPLRRGLGTVDVVITSDNALPSHDLISATQKHIDDLRPVTAKNSLVLAPTMRPVDFAVKVTLDGISLDDAKKQITNDINDAVNRLAPGETLIRSQIETLISLIPGITDRTITRPVGNVTPTVNELIVEWIRVGTVTIGLMG